jgi:hypothetical protein
MRANKPGTSLPPALSKRARADRAGVRIDLVVDEVELTGVREVVFVAERHLHTARRHARVRELQVCRLVDVEIRVDRAVRHDRGEGARAADQIAYRDQGARYAAVDRCGHARVAHVELRRRERRLAGRERSLRVGVPGVRLIERLARDRVRCEQMLRARTIDLRELELAARTRALRFVAVDLLPKRSRVDAKQQLAALDVCAFREVNRLDVSRHPRMQLDAVDRREPSGGVLPIGDRALDHACDRDLGRRRGGRRGLAAATARGEHGDPGGSDASGRHA